MKIYIPVLFIILSLASYGQNYGSSGYALGYSILKVDSLSFSAFIEQSFQKKIRAFDNSDVLGTKGACFIKFQIDSNGKIITRDFTPGPKQAFLNFLFESLEEAQKSWVANSTGKKRGKSELFVLPVYYEFPSEPDIKVSPLDPRELSRFFSDSEKATQVTFLPNVYLHSGYH